MTTPLDEAYEKMADSPDQDAPRLGFYERLVGTELFLLLEAEPTDDKIRPRAFPVEEGEFLLVFDTEARLAEFSGQTSAFVAMSGRATIDMLMAGEGGYGIGINLGVAPSSFLLPHDGVIWLAEMMGNSAKLMKRQPKEFYPPIDVDECFLTDLSTKLAAATGLAEKAVLVGVQYSDETKGNLLAIVGAVPAAESALGQAVGSVVSFSPREVTLDVGFFVQDDERLTQISQLGIELNIPKMAADAPIPGSAPGMDPTSPPKLR